MVMRLDRPNYVDTDLVDEVVAERQRGVNAAYFTGINADWKRRIQEYIHMAGNPEIIRPWQAMTDDEIKTRFLTLYSSPQDHAVQKPVLEDLRKRTLQLCPACGEDGTPNTLDHYLPKNSYPEFAITTVNLFPMCDICQGWKGESTVNQDGERLFLHPYFDEFLSEPVVQLDISGPYNAPRSISLIARPGLAPDLSRLVTRHLSALGITRRFYHYFRDQYIRLIGSAADIRDANLDMRQQITLFYNAARRKAVNSWGHVFYEAVIRNDALLEHLATGDLPIFMEWEMEA